MMKKIAALLVAAACFVGAQDIDNNAQEFAEPGFYIGLHPVSLVIYTALSAPMVFVTFEKPVVQTGSFMVKPGFLYMGESYMDKYVISDDDLEASALGLELAAGYRQYFGGGHRGGYLEADVVYARVSMDFKDNYQSGTATGNSIGFYGLVGWKSRGPVVHSFDIGLMYTHTSAKASGSLDKSNVESAAGAGFGLTGNYAISLGF